MALWQKTYINRATVSSESTSDWSVFCITVCDKVNMFPLWPYLQSNWILCFIYLTVWVTLYGFMALNQVLASSYLIFVCFTFILLYVAVIHVVTFFLPVSISDQKIVLVKQTTFQFWYFGVENVRLNSCLLLMPTWLWDSCSKLCKSVECRLFRFLL